MSTPGGALIHAGVFRWSSSIEQGYIRLAQSFQDISSVGDCDWRIDKASLIGAARRMLKLRFQQPAGGSSGVGVPVEGRYPWVTERH